VADIGTEAEQLLVRLEEIAAAKDLDLAVLRAQAALIHRQADAIQLGQLAVAQRWMRAASTLRVRAC
jgi:hypothetical protein